MIKAALYGTLKASGVGKGLTYYGAIETVMYLLQQGNAIVQIRCFDNIQLTVAVDVPLAVASQISINICSAKYSIIGSVQVALYVALQETL